MTNFEDRINEKYYNDHPKEFMGDFQSWLISMGVPQKYVGKVAAKAYADGHAYGYSEVMNHGVDLADLFNS